MRDPAENSQALRDSRRANSDFDHARAAGASSQVLAVLAEVQASAQARLSTVRQRAG
jgi:hypothetical protein